MKLITAIVQDKDATKLSDKFVENDIRATRQASVGSFLRSGNATFLIAVDDQRVDEVLELIKENSKKRTQCMTSPVILDYALSEVAPIEVEVGGATVIVQDIESFHQF